MSSLGVALVTGAAQGIGRRIALRLADDGFDVAVNDIITNKEKLDNLVAEIVGKGRKSLGIVADVSQDGEVRDMVDKVVKELGSLDVMIANAGIAKFNNIVDLPVEEWDHVFSINTRGIFLCYKYAAKQMISQGRGGRMIGASSVVGKRAEPMGSAYSASKFAVRGLTQSAAAEFGKHGITVNAYAPGAIDTDMLASIDGIYGAGVDVRELNAKAAAVGYLGTPQDIAGLVSYLVSKEAHFITGQSISIDGGRYFD